MIKALWGLNFKLDEWTLTILHGRPAWSERYPDHTKLDAKPSNFLAKAKSYLVAPQSLAFAA